MYICEMYSGGAMAGYSHSRGINLQLANVVGLAVKLEFVTVIF
jgi:hypothetical protein